MLGQSFPLLNAKDQRLAHPFLNAKWAEDDNFTFSSVNSPLQEYEACRQGALPSFFMTCLASSALYT